MQSLAVSPCWEGIGAQKGWGSSKFQGSVPEREELASGRIRQSAYKTPDETQITDVEVNFTNPGKESL